MHREHRGSEPESPAAIPTTETPALGSAQPIDLPSLRLILRQHLDDLRARGADDALLTSVEDELRRYTDPMGDLAEELAGPLAAAPAASTVDDARRHAG